MKLNHSTQLTDVQVKEMIQLYFKECMERLEAQKAGVDKFYEFTEKFKGMPEIYDSPEFSAPTEQMKSTAFMLPEPKGGNKASFGIAGLSRRQAAITEDDVLNYLLEDNQIDINPRSPSAKILKSGIKRALAELNSVHQQHIDYETEVTVNDTWFKAAEDQSTPTTIIQTIAPVKPKGELLSLVHSKYMNEAQGNDKNKQKKQSSFDVFIEIIGDKDIQIVTKKEARTYKEAIMKMPKNWTKRYKGESVQSIIKKQLPAEEYPKTKTLNVTLINMSTFFSWAINNGYFDGNNPFTGLMLKESQSNKSKRHSFCEERLEKIFYSPLYLGCKSKGRRNIEGGMIIQDSLYWLPIIALFSGARMGEICQLRKKDITQDDGVWCMNIRDDEDDQGLKNAQSYRTVPIHKQLVELGFIRYVQSCKTERIFSDISRAASDNKYSSTFSKRFKTFSKGCGAWSEKHKFHSFRHNMADALRAVKTPQLLEDKITGHKSQGVAAIYGNAKEIDLMKEFIDQVTYPIDWQKLKDAQDKILGNN